MLVKRKSSFKELSFTRICGLTLSTDFIRFQPDDGLWYRPKYCIIGEENKSSRLSLKLKLVNRFNTHITH